VRFLITMTDHEGSWEALPEAEQRAILAKHEAYEAELRAEGRLLATGHCHPRSEAVTIRQDEDGDIAVKDGPYHDGTEYLGGFYVIEADSIEDAVAWARRGRFMPGANEVRQLYDD